jgi:hypothetical protein
MPTIYVNYLEENDNFLKSNGFDVDVSNIINNKDEHWSVICARHSAWFLYTLIYSIITTTYWAVTTTFGSAPQRNRTNGMLMYMNVCVNIYKKRDLL